MKIQQPVYFLSMSIWRNERRRYMKKIIGDSPRRLHSPIDNRSAGARAQIFFSHREIINICEFDRVQCPISDAYFFSLNADCCDCLFAR